MYDIYIVYVIKILLNQFNFNHLYYFHLIASTGSIKTACERLRISQPALSIQLRQLEESIGHKAFERKYRKLELTEQGKVLYSYTKKIFSLAEEAANNLTDKKIKPMKILRIGFVPTIFKRTIQSFLLPLWKNQDSLKLYQGSLAELTRLLEDQKIDLIIADAHPLKLEKNWIAKRLGPRRLIIAGHPKFKSLRPDYPQSLTNAAFITFSESNPLRYSIDLFFERHKVYPRIIAEVDDFTLSSLAIEDGVGVGVISENASKDLIRAKKLIEIGEIKDVESELWAIGSENLDEKLKAAILEFKSIRVAKS